MECGIENVTVENRKCMEGKWDGEGEKGREGCDGGDSVAWWKLTW